MSIEKAREQLDELIRDSDAKIKASEKPEEGAMTSYFKRQQAKVQGQIDDLLAVSPVAPAQKVERPRASIDELYAMVGGVDPATQQKDKIYVPSRGLPAGDSEPIGTYGATRADAMSPSTQNGKGAVITNNPNDIYIGGRVPQGYKVNAMYTGEDDTFYLKQKFNPVKPYPLTYPNGRTLTVDTANMDKAAWLYFGLMEPAKPIDFFGYYKMPTAPQKEGAVHAFVRNALNVVPNMAARTAGFVDVTLADIGQGISNLVGAKETESWFANARKLAIKVTNELTNDITWQYGPEGVGDTYANRFWGIGGQAAMFIPLAFANGMAALPVLETMEAADSALYVREAWQDKGLSAWKAALSSWGAGAAVYAIGMAPKAIDALVGVVARPAQGWVHLARTNPMRMKQLFRNKNIFVAAAEGLSEPYQDIATSAMAGETPEWEDALSTLFWSFAISSATLAIDSPDPVKAVQENLAKFKSFVTDHPELLKMVVDGSNGALNADNINEVLELIADPEHIGDLWNYLKEGIIANFDKLTTEQKQQLVEQVKALNPDTDLETEFGKLDAQVDAMLDESAREDAAAGRPPLTQDQRELMKLMIRGVAGQQLANFNILPSQMQIPKRVFGGFSDQALAENAEGATSGDTITVNNQIAESGLPVGRVSTAPVQGSANQRASANVKNEFATAGVSSSQSLGFADLPHEFWHWIETQTGLPNVGEFMAGIQQLAETMVPGITAGKKGVALSEAYAYAMGFAGDKVKAALGITGSAADYVDFMNLMLNAEDIAKGVTSGLQAYMESYRNVLKANKSLIDDILKGYGTQQLRGAVKNFIKTGNPGALKYDDMRALNAILASVVDTDTASKMGQVFDTPAEAQSFMKRYAEEYDALLAKDREGAAAKAAEYRKIANEKVGLGKEITPSTANEQTVAGKVDELLSEDAAVEDEVAENKESSKTEPQEPANTESKPDIEPRKHLDETPYDTDTLVTGGYDDSPEKVLGYLENAISWGKEDGLTASAVQGHKVKLSSINKQLQIKLDPSFGDTKLDHRAAYIILAKHKLAEMKKQGKLTPEQELRAKNDLMFAVRSKMESSYRGDVLNFLATKVAEDTATPDEEALYRSIAKFDKTIDDLYVDFGPYTPVDTARAAKTAALELAIDLNALSASNDGTVKAIINGDISTSEEYLRAMLPEAMDKMVPFDVEPTFENDRLVYKKREKVRSLTEALADYIDALDKFIEDQQFEEERYDLLSDKPSRREARMIGILKSPKTSAQLKKQARAYLGAAGKNAVDPMAKYFTPNYNMDISDRYIGSTDASIAKDILVGNKGSEEERAGARAVLEAGAIQSGYLNPIRGFLKRDIIDTPTPLEEMGMSLQEAEDQIRAAGLEPYDFLNGPLAELAKEKLSPDYVRKNLNNEDPNISLKTRRTMLARLLEEVPSIGESKNRAERLRVLHAISSAKVAVDQIFQDVIDSEDSYNHNPTMNVQAFESAEEFKKTDRFDKQVKEHQARGYTEVVSVGNLAASDEIAFPYGNNIFRGVISYKFKTPAGATGFIILEDVDTAEWRKKDFATMQKPPRQILVAEPVLQNAGFLRKPLESADFSRYPELLNLFDEICAARPEWKNYTRMAEAAIKEATEDMELRSQIAKLEGTVESDVDVAVDEDNPENDYYAVRSDVPEIDPGVFPLMEGGLTDEEFRELFNQTEEEYLRHLEEGVSTPGERQLMWERLRDKEEGLKPHFENYGKGLIKNIDALNEGLEERKMGKFGRALLLGAWQTGLDRKLRAIFGEKATNGVANTTVAASVAQEISEAKRHAFDKALTNDVFKGSRKNYENWLSKITAVSYKTKLANGQEVDITKDEVLGIAWAKRAVEKKLVDTRNYTNPYERMRAFYSNTEELLSRLTEEDWAFIDLALEAAADARGVNSLIPQYWPGSTIGDDYIRKGWGARLKNTPDNSTRVISSQQPLAATGAFASVMSIIGAKSLQESGLTTKLRTLRDILVFEDIDLSMYQQLNEDEVAIYNELKEKAAALKFNLEKKIGSTMFKWLIDNIDVDLKFNPLVRDMTKNPVMGGFQKVTRSVASSLLMLNLKQGYVNLGGYDMFLGLSNSSTAKFFTTDRINAWAHIREAWKLAMSISEFKRRLEQSGLSEQMRRVADMNEESLLKDIQQALYKGDNGKAGDLVGAINTLSKISAKYGLATNVVPDLVGIALGTYAVWNDVLAKNGGNVEKAQNEIVAHVLNRVSSSNYMTRSAATKLLHRAGLEALVAFKNDQLQKVGMICEAALTLMNSSDPAVRRAAWKDIQAAAYSTLRYIAIQAGWIAAMVQLASGHDLDDEEKDYLYEATVREVLSQIGDTTQMGSFVVQLLTGIYEGRDMGMTLIPFGGAQRASTAFRKGNFIKGAGETGALLGITPVAPGAVRLIDGLVRMASEDEKEQAVGRLMVAGRSEPTAQKMMGYSRGQKTGKLRNKQSRKKEKEEK